MPSPAALLIANHIRINGPITFAEFMELALYHPEVGYYAAATQRSGRTGDFYTSVDVGPLFGALLAEAFVAMFDALDASEANASERLDLVEVGAGNGRLSRDVLDGLERMAPGVSERVRLHLVERSATARARHTEVLGPHAGRLASSLAHLPRPKPRPTRSGREEVAGQRWRGILFANELLDALPTHVVVGTAEGLREIYVDVDDTGALVEREGPASTPALAQYLERVGARLEPGWRAEVNLAAVEWLQDASAALDRGFIVLIDYGHEAPLLYSASHAAGTLASFTSHVVEVHEGDRPQPWLREPGVSDITAHVDFTTMRHAAGEAGLHVLFLVEQARFLMTLGHADRHLSQYTGDRRDLVAARLALKTLLLPGGIGSTHQVLALCKQIDSRFLESLANPQPDRIK